MEDGLSSPTRPLGRNSDKRGLGGIAVDRVNIDDVYGNPVGPRIHYNFRQVIANCVETEKTPSEDGAYNQATLDLHV